MRSAPFDSWRNFCAPVAAALATLLLVACGATPSKPEPTSTKPVTPAKSTAQASPKRGGAYYLDDGPGDNPPPDLDRLPDAVPRLEPLRPASNRPYEVFGKSYNPMTSLQPYRRSGVASWYGRRYHGKPTSSGEIYDMYAMTAAHPTLPIPSYARVTNLKTQRTVVVRINDRGPFLHDRVIDLSYAAAHRIGTLADGSGAVEVELIIPGREVRASYSVPVDGQAAPTRAAVAERIRQPAVLEEVSSARGIFLQLGAFGAKDNAEAFAARVRGQAGDAAGTLDVFSLNGLYRVQSGPYASDAEAREAATKLASRLGIKALVTAR